METLLDAAKAYNLAKEKLDQARDELAHQIWIAHQSGESYYSLAKKLQLPETTVSSLSRRAEKQAENMVVEDIFIWEI